MKKLLILALVMGVASTANATLTLVSSNGDTLDPAGVAYPMTTVIGIHNDTAAAGQGLLTWLAIPDADPGSWTGTANIHVPPQVTGGEYNTHYGVVDPGVGNVDLWESNMSVASTTPFGIGILTDFEFVCTDLGDVTITMYADDIATVLDTLTIHQIPEPITFALLGLGGLFLRRRK